MRRGVYRQTLTHPNAPKAFARTRRRSVFRLMSVLGGQEDPAHRFAGDGPLACGFRSPRPRHRRVELRQRTDTRATTGNCPANRAARPRYRAVPLPGWQAVRKQSGR